MYRREAAGGKDINTDRGKQGGKFLYSGPFNSVAGLHQLLTRREHDKEGRQATMIQKQGYYVDVRVSGVAESGTEGFMELG